MDRLQEKNSMFVKLGALFRPLQQLVEHPEQYDEQETAEAIAQYCAEIIPIVTDFERFSKSQKGYDYSVQYIQFYGAIYGLRNNILAGKSLSETLDAALAAAKAAISAVPVPRTSVILEAGSPFTAYCRLRELCESDATTTLVWMDAYFDASIFRRYLTGVRDNAPVTLVAQEPGPNAGKTNFGRWTAFLDVSRLYAAERGPTKYRLIIQPSLHDRWVIFDDKRIYTLGGSAKDAANKDYFTIASIDATASNLQKVTALIISGTEYFGPTQTTHV